MRPIRSGAALAAVLVTAVVPQAFAADPSVLEEVLEILLEEGKIDEARYRDLLERHREELAATTPAVSAAPESDAKGWSFQWKDGFRLERNDGYHKLKFGGRIQNDWAVIKQDNGLVNRGSNSNWITGTEFRRARLFFSGTLFERLIFNAQYDFADGDPAFKDVFVGLLELGPIDEVRVGHFKEPFGLEQLASSKYITFLERSLSSVFDPDRNTGVELQKAYLDQRLTTTLSAFRVTDDFGSGFGNRDDYDIATRITGLPYYGDEGKQLVHLGLGYYHGFRENRTVDYRQRPEMHMANRLLDTGDILGVQNIDGFGPEFAWVFGPFSLQSELKAVLLQRNSMSDVFLWGTYAEASYFLTGEHRVYKQGAGAFDRVAPIHSFDPVEGHWGAFQVAARYSYLDLDDEDVAGGREDGMTLGLNWHLFSNARVSLNYVWGRVRGQGDVNGAQTRFQVDF